MQPDTLQPDNRKKHSRRWRILWLAVYIALTLFCVGTAFGGYIYAYGQLDRPAKADVIIILGSGTNADGSPSRGEVRRVRHGVALYNKGYAPYILCTGGFTRQHPVSEARACADLAVKLGVPAEAILLEESSKSTEENAIYSLKTMTEHDLKTGLLVSDNFHLLRADWVFQRYGIALTGSSPAQVTSGPLFIGTAIQSTYREVLAWVWYGIKFGLHLPFTDVSL